MRRAVVALSGVVAGTTLLISLKSAPGASRLPRQVLEDEARGQALAAAASPTPTADPAYQVPSLPGVPALTPPPTTAPPPAAPQQRPLPSRTPTAPAPTGTRPANTPIQGDSALTEFGYVTVAITVSNGRITDVIAVEMPSAESRSVTLSNTAAPILRQRALQAQGVHFDTVSGATWTSLAYQQSLGSAMQHAGLDATR